MPNDIAVARYIPPVSIPDMERMAHAVVHSGLFGIKTVPQAMTLMLIAQAEGRHPVLAARDYDIIQGRPSKKAEAMLRDFLMSGGTVEWKELSDTVAEATFTHPKGGSVPIRWDMEIAKQAGLLGKAGDMWKKYPRAMLRSRCISEGIRTVCPMATSGMYLPEEVRDFDDHPKRREIKDVTSKPEPVVSETAAPAGIIDAQTGEVFDHDTLMSQSRIAAQRGWAALKTHLQLLPDEAYEVLKPYVGTAQYPGELRQIAAEADGESVNPDAAEQPPTARELDDAIPF